MCKWKATASFGIQWRSAYPEWEIETEREWKQWRCWTIWNVQKKTYIQRQQRKRILQIIIIIIMNAFTRSYWLCGWRFINIQIKYMQHRALSSTLYIYSSRHSKTWARINCTHGMMKKKIKKKDSEHSEQIETVSQTQVNWI